MKRILIVLGCMVIIVYALSCSKSDSGSATCSGVRAPLDSTALLAFAKQYGITPTQDTSYMYYQIMIPGSGAAPNLASKVYVRYVARLMNGDYLDSSAVSTRFALDSLILGWQYGLPKIMPGGRIKLLVPSALAYGCSGNGTSIPVNAPVYFDIYLDSLK